MKHDRSGNAVSDTPEVRRTATRVGRNASFRLGAQVMSSLINVAGMVLIGNFLHAEGYGQYAFYYAMISLIGSLGDLGVGIIVTRTVARDLSTGPRTFGDALLVKGMVSSLIVAGVAIFAWTNFAPGHAALICLVTATAMLDLSQDASIWIFRAHERQDLEALLELTSQVARIAGLGLCVLLGLSLPWFIGAATLAFVLRLAVGALMVRRAYYGPVFRPDWARIRGLMLQGLPFGMAMFGILLYGRVGVFMLQGLASSADVALFNVGYMLSQPLGFLSSALSMSAFPVLSRYALNDPTAMRTALRKSSKYQLLITLPITTGLFLLADRVVPMLFRGSDFARAAMVLQIMSLGLTFIFLNLMARYVLTALDRQRDYMRAVLVGLVVNAALCAVLIPRAGSIGACAAFIGAEAAILMMCQHTLSRWVPVADLFREAARPLLAAIAMGVVVIAIGAAPLPVVIAVGAVVYGVMLLVLRAFTPRELDILRGVYVSFRLPGSAYLARVGDQT